MGHGCMGPLQVTFSILWTPLVVLDSLLAFQEGNISLYISHFSCGLSYRSPGSFYWEMVFRDHILGAE